MAEVETVRVALNGRGYDIAIGAGLLAEAGARIATVAGSGRLIVVTDSHVAPLHLEPLMGALANAGREAASITVDAGEASKDFTHLESLIGEILDLKIDRGATLIALGGGVIGDLTGFAAAIALRGIRFIQIPTTLLAQVDSSVGGKTGINTRHGKNLIGSFHQPALVIADTATLSSLPDRELRAGYAEVVKTALIDDPDFFAWLEARGQGVIDGDADARRHAVATCCRAKARVVAEDEREAGRRQLLNLGHTFGHALEAECGYGDALLHGEAVAIGTVIAFDLSARLGLCPADDAARVRAHFAGVGLPVGAKVLSNRLRGADALIEHMSRDKKVRDGRIRFVLARGIGGAFVTDDVDPAALRASLDSALAA